MIPIRTENLDREAVLRFHGTKQNLKQCAKEIHHNCNIFLTQLQEATASGNAPKLEENARELANTLTILSPPAALDLALLLERQGRTNTLTDSPQTLKRLKAELNLLYEIIANL